MFVDVNLLGSCQGGDSAQHDARSDNTQKCREERKEEEHEEKDSHYKKSEFRYGEFSRTVYFPKDIDVEKTTAKLEHGILKIKAPKLEKEKDTVKKITVK